METHLMGKTVLVTDPTRNFGPATALAFAREGANLLLNSPDGGDRLEQTVREATRLGVKAVTHQCDVADQTQVSQLVAKGLSEFGRLDVVINNALFALPSQSLADTTFEVWSRKIQVEITGSLLICQAVLPAMVERQWGRIINYIGLAGFQGTDAASATTELGLVGLTRGIAREYGKHNITANCIGPGGVKNEDGFGDSSGVGPGEPPAPAAGDPIPRLGNPQEAAFLAVSLASQDAGYITGQCLLVNGGKYFL